MLKDPELAVLYPEECLEDGDMELFTAALKDVAEAYGGMSYLSQVTHLNRETLYRTLSKDGNPRLDTLHKVLRAMGLCIGMVPMKKLQAMQRQSNVLEPDPLSNFLPSLILMREKRGLIRVLYISLNKLQSMDQIAEV